MVADLVVLASLVLTTGDSPAPVPAESPVPSPADATPGSGRRIPFGSFGEIHFTSTNGKSAGNEVDLHRFVLFVGHRFDLKTAVYSEVEIEHGGDEVAMEQLYLEYAPNRLVGARAGLLLVPIGIVNVLHEPPTFHGVERTTVDRVIVPTTWREPGVSIFGEPLEGLRYQLGVVNGLDASGFSAGSGIRGGRQGAGEAAMNDIAVVVRLDYAPIRGLDAGATFYAGGAGQDASGIRRTTLTMYEADVRGNVAGASMRAQYARGVIGGAEELAIATTAAGGTPIGAAFEGYYAEASYDVMRLVRGAWPSLAWELWPFARYEYTNTHVSMPEGFVANGAFEQSVVTAGVSVKPDPRVVLKADYQWTDAVSGNPPNVWNLGIGYMF